MMGDWILPAAVAVWAWLSGRGDSAPPPVTPTRGWPKVEPPTTPTETPPGYGPPGADRIDPERYPIDPSTDQPRGMLPGTTSPGASMADRAIRAERERQAQPWRPARRVTPAEVERAKALLAPGYWHTGLIAEESGVQYRGAWHPNRSGTGKHKGVEVWRRGG